MKNILPYGGAELPVTYSLFLPNKFEFNLEFKS